MFMMNLVRRRVFVVPLVLGAALLLAAACGDDGEGVETHVEDETPAADETPAGAATAEIKMIPAIQFDKSELTIPANTDVTITADNIEAGVAHNFALYASQDEAESSGASLAETEIRMGPFTDTATVNLSAGEYFFRCNVHPTQMVGTLIVE